MVNPPLAYFITFRTYGTWLHGDERGSVDREHNVYGTPTLPVEKAINEWEGAERTQEPVTLSGKQRSSVDATIRNVCRHRGWALRELNVRTNHIHAIVTADDSPESVMNAFKSWSTRRLREAGLMGQQARVWSRHGSTVYLFDSGKLAEKCRYVRECQ